MDTQNLAKWISELQAQIDQVKRMAIAAGSSGGDTVTITPALESGTKIADYTIGEDTSGSLYAPTPETPDPAFDYSETEAEIGTWIDGRPLYRKTFAVGDMPNNTTKNVETLTVEEVKQLYGVCAAKAEGSIDMRPLPMVDSNASNNIRVDVTSSVLQIISHADWSSYTGYLTIVYTKSTDPVPNTSKKRRIKK